MRKAEPLVTCLGCKVVYYDVNVFKQHVDVSKNPEKWGPCKQWRKELVRCIRCRKRFFYAKNLVKHWSYGDCKKWEVREGKSDESEEETKEEERGAKELRF
jgi:hypothetical protein